MSQGMESVMKQVQGSLNASLKKQLPKEYSKIMDDMAGDIKLKNDIKRLFGINDEGIQV